MKEYYMHKNVDNKIHKINDVFQNLRPIEMNI
jgi:hypothetical protein